MKRTSNCLSSINEQITLANIVSLISLAIIAGGIATSVYMNCVNRSLWLDEALLAYSFCKRSFFQLWNGPLENMQSAPLGWLYLEKCFAVLLGNTEFVLRICSILGFIFTIVGLYYLLKQLSVTRAFCLSACAFYANIPFILKYSNVFKPYIFDGFVVLLAILVFLLYEQDRIHTWVLTIVWSALIWFSTPVCFFEGGLLLSAGILCLIKRDVRRLKVLIFIGITIVVSFAVCYFFWLGDNSIVDGMQKYWKGQNFPLIPTSLNDLKKMKEMVKELTKHFENQSITVLLAAVFSIPIAIKRKQATVMGGYLGILLSLFASWLNMYPIEDRMWCFIYPCLIFLAFYGMFYLSQEKKKWGRLLLCLIVGMFFYPQFKLKGAFFAFYVAFAISELLKVEFVMNVQNTVALALACFLVFSVRGIRQYWNNAEAVFWKGEELNTEIAYLENNIKDDELVYVYSHSVPGFQFKNGYYTNSIAKYDNNVIYGSGFFQKNDKCDEELDKIISRDKVYIASSHITVERLEKLIDAIYENGFLQLVTYEYQTPLWFYCRSIEDSKIHVSYETKSIEGSGNTKVVKVLFHNEGPAYINHQFEEVSVVNTSTGEKYKLPQNIKPGSTTELTLSYEGESVPVFILENQYGLICADSEYVPPR